MVFADTSTPSGAALVYNGNIPSEDQNPDDPTVAKKELQWSRNDIYFYDTNTY